MTGRTGRRAGTEFGIPNVGSYVWEVRRGTARPSTCGALGKRRGSDLDPRSSAYERGPDRLLFRRPDGQPYSPGTITETVYVLKPTDQWLPEVGPGGAIWSGGRGRIKGNQHPARYILDTDGTVLRAPLPGSEDPPSWPAPGAAVPIAGPALKLSPQSVWLVWVPISTSSASLKSLMGQSRLA